VRVDAFERVREGEIVEEIDRVEQHFVDADREVRPAARPGLTPLQHLVRELLLEELVRYRAARRFPLNRDFDVLRPYFVDAEGTRCAVAHLLEVGGKADLVQRIVRERNNATVAELADEEELVAWLDAAGLSVDEAARIQPSYRKCSPSVSSCLCAIAPRGVVEGEFLIQEGRSNSFRVDAVYGEVLGARVGDELPLSAGTNGFRKALALVAPGRSAQHQEDVRLLGRPGTLLDQRGLPACVETGLMIPTEHIVAAITQPTAEACIQRFDALDPAYLESQWCDDDGLGCTATRGIAGTDATFGILVALATSLGFRRAARSRRMT
jgi:hypothetical protein